MSPEPSTADLASDILRLIDLTSLSSTDNEHSIDTLCSLAKECHDLHGLPYPAAICVYPNFTAQVKFNMRGTGVAVAAVAGAFPSGQSPLSVRLAEVDYCLMEGADEIDMVISRGRLLMGDEKYISEEVQAIKQLCGGRMLKVILETCELSPAQIRTASKIALESGADFIKTSTGKGSEGATMEGARIMLEAIAEYWNSTGNLWGFKAAGGISTISQAQQFIDLGRSIIGEEYVNPSLFRIGASRLVKEIIASH